MNWDCAEERAALLDSAGIAEYERRLAEHLRACTVAVINGHAIRSVQTKFGKVFIVVGSKYAFTDLAAAQRHAYKLGEIPDVQRRRARKKAGVVQASRL